MQPSPTNLTLAAHNSKPGRRILAALLAAMALAIVAGSALAANMLTNGGFEQNLSNGWGAIDLTSADKRVCNQSYAGDCSFKLVGDGNAKTLRQTLTVSGDLGDKFTLSAWTKGKDLDLGTGAVSVNVLISHVGDGSSAQSFVLPAGSSPWTKRKVTVTAGADYDQIIITIHTQTNVTGGKAWFDQVKLAPKP